MEDASEEGALGCLLRCLATSRQEVMEGADAKIGRVRPL